LLFRESTIKCDDQERQLRKLLNQKSTMEEKLDAMQDELNDVGEDLNRKGYQVDNFNEVIDGFKCEKIF
jgi:uncharacterized protein (UPF0335 family)